MQHTREGRLYTDIVLELFKLGGLLISEGDELTKELGLTSARWKVLGALAYADSPKTVSQIAYSMGQTRQGVQRLSDAMVKEGILVYEDNPHHKKAKLVTITPKGEDVFLALERKQIPWANKNSAEISAQEMEVALDVLKKMVRRLET
ncbi:MarR family winged helix-turn-helix transcriptional regulator [Halomonas sp. B23F22_20]|uniref:MarR family winged helix-turn-helix transcriptional regulator n=1 Tax=Halomonas sp. B23F22_10 TaxID=3459515 RepID=UPI0037482E42